jgi:hypothetical protein
MTTTTLPAIATRAVNRIIVRARKANTIGSILNLQRQLRSLAADHQSHSSTPFVAAWAALDCAAERLARKCGQRRRA